MDNHIADAFKCWWLTPSLNESIINLPKLNGANRSTNLGMFMILKSVKKAVKEILASHNARVENQEYFRKLHVCSNENCNKGCKSLEDVPN